MTRIHAITIFVVIPVLSAGACTNSPDSSITETPLQENQYLIASNTQLTYRTLSIGAGNFWEETYQGPDNKTVTGLTAGLWLSIKDRPELGQHVRAHPGQEVDLAQYHILVLEVRPHEVLLQITSS